MQKELSHIDLVLSQFPIEVLHSLQTSIMQEIQLCMVSTSMELTKVVADNDVLQEEYDKLMLERDEVAQRTKRLKQVVQGVYSNIPEVSMEVDTPLEEQVTKISEAIQGFHMKIIDLEACQTPSTPPEEREKREKTIVMTVESIKSMDEECVKLYEGSTQVWTVLLENT
jgi:hypothetical protein